MPAKNRIKTYVADGFYHVYNRGIEKRTIFVEKKDYVVLLGLLKKYLTKTPVDQNPTKIVPLVTKDLYDEIDLLSYCLMPNHFHFLLKQKKPDSMTKFLRRVFTSYSSYFNRKYERVGTLFQGNYKAVYIDNEPRLLHLSRYIHLNPARTLEGRSLRGTVPVEDLRRYEWSSYPEYLGERKTKWVKTDLILSHFNASKNQDISLKNFNTYQSFVEDYHTEAKEMVGQLAID